MAKWMRVDGHTAPRWVAAVAFFALVYGGIMADRSFYSEIASAAGSDWAALGQPVKAFSSVWVDVDASRHALNPSLVFVDTTPFLGWIELNTHGVSRVHVRHWDRSEWVKDGGALNMDATHRASDLTMSSNGKTPYLAWTELTARDIPHLYVKHLVGDQWVIDGARLNVDPTHRAVNPALAVAGTVPYLAWSEPSARVFQLYVKHLSDDGWHLDGVEGLNRSPTRDAIEPAIALQGSVPFVAWIELSDQNVYQAYVKRRAGSTWEGLGESLNLDPKNHASSPAITFVGETPYVAWTEINAEGISQIHVKHWDNGSWISDGGSVNIDPARHALSPALIGVGSAAYIAWTEYDAKGITQIHVKHWSETRWESDDPQLNTIPATASSAPFLASSASSLYVAWREVYQNGISHIVVKRLPAE
ncbi:MAG: hypothetical protein HY204_08515 [Nitrospirae bacterium]|nr:hypothetical protein [Nitrospirota bacterium]